MVPKVSTAEIAEGAGMDDDRSVMVLRLVVTCSIFEEVDGEMGSFWCSISIVLLARDDCFWKRMYVDILVLKGYHSNYSPTLHMSVQRY